MNVSHHMPDELKQSEFKMNSIIQDRETIQYIPINGSQTYDYESKKEIEFQISTSHLVDFKTLQLCFQSDASFNDLASNCIQSVQVYLNDELIENVENYNMLEQAMTLASSNPGHYNGDLNILQGAHKYNSGAVARSGDFVLGLGMLGITHISQFLPVGNMRIVIRLEDPARCASSSYSLGGVKLLMDVVKVIPSYEQRLKSLMRSEKGVAIPLISYESRRRQLEELNVINMSYTELQSVFAMVDSGNVAEMPFPVTSFKAHMNNKFFSMPTTGLDTLPKMYIAMKKSLGGSQHDATGHSLFDYPTYKDKMTVLGVDCEKSAGHHSLLNNGINTKENAYQFNLEFTYNTVPANSKLQVFTLFKKVLTFNSGGVKVLE